MTSKDKMSGRTFWERLACQAKHLAHRVCRRLYLSSYWVGSWLFRRFRVHHRRANGHAQRLRVRLWHFQSRRARQLQTAWRGFVRRLKAPFAHSAAYLQEASPKLTEAFRRGFGPGILQFLRTAGGFLKVNLPVLRTALNYAMPCAALVLLLGTVHHFTSQEYGLSIQYSGESIGYIADESVFTTAENKVKERLSTEEYQETPQSVPQYQVVPVQESMLYTEDALTEKLMLSTGSDLVEASGLYIDGKFVGATTNPSGVIQVLDRMLDYYRSGDESEDVQFIQPVALKQGMYPVSAVELTDQIESTLNSTEKEQQTYTVKEGDVPTEIAEKVGMPYSQLKQLNPNIEKELLIGQEVLISRSVPLLGVKVIRTETHEESIAYSTETTKDSSKNKGYKKVTVSGENGIRSVTERVVYVDGAETQREVLHSEVVKEPVTQQVVEGTAIPSSGSISSSTGDGSYSGRFIWPVAGGYVSCGFMGYAGHTGMDIAAHSGTTIYAAASGTVVRSIQSGPYGQHIIIDHGNGVQTLYAHCSARYVQVGDYVSQGQAIAAVGRTGNATGNHCHFEIRTNGRYQNPAKYIGTR